MFGDKFKATLVKITAVACAVATIGVSASAYASNYLPSTRDTKLPPEAMTYDIADLHKYEFLCETEYLKYYFREDRDIIAIEDKRNGYVWKTGADLAFGNDLNAAIKAAKTEEEKRDAAEPKEKSLNATYVGIANSLISVEYYESDTLKTISSAAQKGAESRLLTVDNDPTRRCLEVSFSEIDLQLKVYINFLKDSIEYEIPYEEITGEGKLKMASVLLTPFLGASGGEAQFYDFEKGAYGEAEKRYMIPGYVFVPDGCGGLIRFADNEVAFTEYVGDVYGPDLSTETYYYSSATDVVPLKNPVMPVFGVAHGDSQAAFVSYANEGAEYMEIIVRPEENKKVLYTWAYPRFEYNSTYFQVYNKQGAGYFSMRQEPEHVNVSMVYTFLAGDGSKGDSFSADYCGMAAAYREHLIESGELRESNSTKGEMPIRIDFIMGDSKSGILGEEQVTVTNVDDIDEILSTLQNDGIRNINSGIIGWQKGGETLTRPDKLKFTGSIGRKGTFEKLIDKYNELGIDVSFARETSTINNKMTSYFNVAAKHINTWYLSIGKEALLPENAPVSQFSLATAEKTAEWSTHLANKLPGDSITLSGISNILISSFDRSGIVTSATDAIGIYEEALKEISKTKKVNLSNPNMYLWKYTDRYLEMPVGTSQYVFETDTVPFLQMVLHGSLEMYAPYSNFSFYTDTDVLKMIDYNISPSFIISKEPSYLLADTVSSDLYSTEFSQYEELICSIYLRVNEVLGEVNGYTWTDRTVLENGVIENTYDADGKTVKVIINYTDESFKYGSNTVDAMSAKVIK